MADASLQGRLRQHERAFDGLLSLIPAKLYYGNGDEPSEQWLRKKQTKSEKSAARRANLDPENELNKSVKEVMAERTANKRKLEQISGTQKKKGKQAVVEEEEDDEEENDDEDDDESIDGVAKETPGEGLKRAKENATKKQKTKPAEAKEGEAKEADAENDDNSDDEEDLGVSLEDSNLSAKQQKKLLKKHAKAEKRAEKRKNKTQKSDEEETKADAKTDPKKDTKKEKAKKEKKQPEPAAEESDVENDMDVDNNDDEADNEADNGGLISGVGFSGLLGDEDVPSAPSSPSAKSDTFDTPLPSTESKDAASSNATSVTSIASVTIPTTFSDSLIKPPSPTSSIASSSKLKVTVPKDTSALRARLAARIAELRAARKADVDEVDSSGNVIRTRQQLIEDRRQKQAERKVHKKELRRAARLEEDRKREEAVASARGSPLVRVGGDDAAEPVAVPEPEIKTNFSFGRVAFQDGAQMSHDWSYVKDGAAAQKKRNGPASNDVKAQLARLESQKKRLEKMDDAQRKDIEEKERWLAARKRAEGVGRGDGASLTATAAAAGALSMADGTMKSAEQMLKKAIKRKDKVKKKSEKEWGERKEGVQKSIQDRQRKREDNLRKRKEDKMLRRAGLSKKAKKGTGGGGGGKGRPGFEGSFGGRKK